MGNHPCRRTEFVLTTLTGKPLSDIAISEATQTPYVHRTNHCSRSEVIIPNLVSGDRR